MSAATAKKKKNNPPVSFQVEKKQIVRFAVFLFVFSFLLYANTLHHSYILDDYSVIKENGLTKGGVSSIKEIMTTSYRNGYGNNENNLYRPLSKVMFAIEWQLSPNNPHLGHFINVLLFSFSCSLLFIVLMKYIKMNVYILFIASLLFAAHPIHTEVVANIKSRDEILSMLFILLSLFFIYNYIGSKKIIALLSSIVCFFLALLSKESAIIFVGITPLMIYFFTDTPSKKNLKITLFMVVPAVIYLFIHFKVLGSIGLSNIPPMDNSLLMTSNVLEQKATAILIMGKYLLLLFIPHPLSCDYSWSTIPTVTSIANGGFLLSAAINIFLLVYAVLKFKEKNFLSFCILFYFISMSIASNIFILIGTNMAERLLYFPSIAFSLAIAYLLFKWFKVDITTAGTKFSNFISSNKSLFAILGLVLILFSLKTIARNKIWKNDSLLYETDLKTVPNSAHMLFYNANNLTNKDSLKIMSPERKEAQLAEAQKDINKALSIYEVFPDAHNVAGRIWYEYKNYDMAYKSYNRALELNPNKGYYHNNIGTCLFSIGNYAEAAKAFQKATELDVYDADAFCNLGSAYGAMGQAYLQKNDKDNAYKMFQIAIANFEKTAKLDPTYKSAYAFLSMTYLNMGDSLNGKKYQEQADRIRP